MIRADSSKCSRRIYIKAMELYRAFDFEFASGSFPYSNVFYKCSRAMEADLMLKNTQRNSLFNEFA